MGRHAPQQTATSLSARRARWCQVCGKQSSLAMVANKPGAPGRSRSNRKTIAQGRPVETEALIGSILEMAKLTNTAAPAIESVYALVKLLNKVMLLEGSGEAA
jgi:ketopantoate reductase